jgi:hypothetical protein
LAQFHGQRRDDDARSIADQPFEPVDAGSTPHGTEFRCALCGTRFTHGRQVCASCPLNAGCELVTCPSCGYSFPRRSFVVDWLRRMIRRRERSPR